MAECIRKYGVDLQGHSRSANPRVLSHSLTPRFILLLHLGLSLWCRLAHRDSCPLTPFDVRLVLP